MEQERTRRSGGRKIMGGCSALIAGIVIILLVRLMIGSRPPHVEIPYPAMPSPNAFDAYRSAGKQMLDDRKIGDAVSSKPTVTYTRADKAKFVSENAPALQTLRQGFASDYRNPPARSFTTLFPYYAQFRSLARLLKLEGQLKAEKGDWSGAVASDLDAVRMGEEIPRGSVLIGDLVGIACQAIGRKDIWAAIDHLDAAQARKAAAQLEAINARHVPFADALLEEKWCGQAGLQEIFQQKNGLQQMLASATNPQGTPTGASAVDWTQLLWMLYSKERIMTDYSQYMDKLIATDRQPYSAHLSDPPVPNDPICQILFPVFTQARFKDASDEAENHLLQVALALRAYRVERGAYPTSLNELAPGYLSKMPNDPFDSNGAFRYKRQGEKYLLYSVGPDGIDDGGKPVDDPSKASANSPNARYNVAVESKGDIVAGVNP